MLLLVLLILFGIWWWRRYSTFFRVPWYFWFSLEAIQWAFLAKKESFPAFLFQKVATACKRYEKEGAFVVGIIEPELYIFREDYIKMVSSNPTMVEKAKKFEVVDSTGKHGSIILSGGQKWRKERKIINPAFKASVLKSHIPMMNKHSVDLVQEIRECGGDTKDRTLDISKRHLMKLFVESTVGLASDAEGYEDKIKCFIDITENYLDTVSCRMFQPWLAVDFFWKRSRYYPNHRKTYDTGLALLKDIIREIKERFVSQDLGLESKKFQSLGDILMEHHFKDPTFTEDNMAGQLFGIIAAGYETTASTITWAFWFLGLHQDIQEKAFEEIVQNTDQYISSEDLQRLPYLECIIKETMRIYPVVPLIGKQSQQDVECGNFKIPKNMQVWVFTYAVHRNPDVYPAPETFNPDRFLNGDSSNSNWNFLPFGEGQRFCIGKSYALLTMKISIAHVLRNFKIISLDRREDFAESWAIVLKTVTPLHMKFIPREFRDPNA